MVFGKNVVIWDLDDTLYNRTEEFSDLSDKTMAEALVYDLKVPLDLDVAKEIVAESYRLYRDGGEIFYNDYGINSKDLFFAYHKRKPVEKIIPCPNLVEKLEQIPAEQYIFTANDRSATDRILKHLGLYEFFKNRYYSVEDFGVYTKNKSDKVYRDLCQKIGALPEECVFVDDSYSNLEYAKQAGMTTVRIYYNNNSTKDKAFIDYAYKGVENFIDCILRGDCLVADK